MRAALQQMYAAHGYVCTHFGGESMPQPAHGSPAARQRTTRNADC
jgi:hypothetical protein